MSASDSFHRSLNRTLHEQHLPAPELCTHLMRWGTQTEPPEYCDNDAEPDEVYCAQHLQERDDTDPWRD